MWGGTLLDDVNPSKLPKRQVFPDIRRAHAALPVAQAKSRLTGGNRRSTA